MLETLRTTASVRSSCTGNEGGSLKIPDLSKATEIIKEKKKCNKKFAYEKKRERERENRSRKKLDEARGSVDLLQAVYAESFRVPTVNRL